MRQEKEDAKKRKRELIVRVIVCFLSLGMCILFLFFASDTPLSREEATVYEGDFGYYEHGSSTRPRYDGRLVFQNERRFFVLAEVESDSFLSSMEALEEGARLTLLVDMENERVMEIRRGEEVLLSFERTERMLKNDCLTSFLMALFILAVGVALAVLTLMEQTRLKRALAERAQKRKRRGESPALRYADFSKKGRILLETKKGGYTVCYRRLSHTNELIINGKVYDEKKGILETEHALCAVLDGHTFEAGLDADGFSYITLDGELLDVKERKI